MKEYLSEIHIASIKPFYTLLKKSKALYNIINYNIIKWNHKWEENYTALQKIYNNWEYSTLQPTQRQQLIKILLKDWKSYKWSKKSFYDENWKVKRMPWMPWFKKKFNSLVFTINNISDDLVLQKRTLNYQLNTKLKKEQIKEVKVVPFSKNKVKIIIAYKKETPELKQNWIFMWIDLWRDRFFSLCTENWNWYTYNNKSIIAKNNYRNYKGSFKKIWNQINDIIHKQTRKIVNYCINNNVNQVVVWWNDEIKQKSKLKHFVQLPHMNFVKILEYKLKMVWINLIKHEESYTSKIDHFAFEPLSKQENYLGTRKKWLFTSSTGKILNADVNWAIWILRKIINDKFLHNLHLNPISSF